MSEFNGTKSDPCRLVRQVKEIGRLDGRDQHLHDPCHLVYQVNEILHR